MTDAQLIAQADIIRNETAASGNTRARVADMFNALIANKPNKNVPPVPKDASGLISTEEVMMVDCSASPVELTLPASDSTNNGKEYTAIKVDGTTNLLSFKASVGQLISGQAIKSIDTQWAGYKIKSTGSGYIVIANI